MGRAGRFVSERHCARQEAGSGRIAPRGSPPAKNDLHIGAVRRELGLGRPVVPPAIGCALRGRARGLQLQKRLGDSDHHGAYDPEHADNHPRRTDAHRRASSRSKGLRTRPDAGHAVPNAHDGSRGREGERRDHAEGDGRIGVPRRFRTPGSPSSAAGAVGGSGGRLPQRRPRRLSGRARERGADRRVCSATGRSRGRSATQDSDGDAGSIQRAQVRRGRRHGDLRGRRP